MTRDELKIILSSEHDPTRWRIVLTDVFGATNLRAQPTDISSRLADYREIANAAFELGSFNTSDNRIIGLYQVDLTDKPRIWQNRVGLRALLKNVYTHDVDAALVVFIQKHKWRLSLISEIKVRDEEETSPARKLSLNAIPIFSVKAKLSAHLLKDLMSSRRLTERLRL